jgi:hypothetical protein
MLNGISTFEWKRVENFVRLPAAPVHRNRVAFKVWLQFMQNMLRKHHRALVEVVEGTEIYNFAIYPSMHFSSSFGRKTWSK